MAGHPAFAPLTRLALILCLILSGAVLFSGEAPRSAESPANALTGVVYLAPAGGYPRNLVLRDPAGGPAQQLTAVEEADGVHDFAVSPDGSQIVYARASADYSLNLWLLDLNTRRERPLTDCGRAVCTAPAWKPDGTQIAYQRLEFGAPSGASRVWLVDVQTAQSRLLFDDPQVSGSQPTWDPTGRRVAVYDASVAGIRVLDFATQSQTVIENQQDANGTFSPDGTRLVYPILVRSAGSAEFYTHLELADLDALDRRSLSGPEDTPVEDTYAAWSPDGSKLALTRRYLDDRHTPGKQLYLLDLATGEAVPLVVDAAYNHAGMRWDAAGQRIVFQRVSLEEPNDQPQVWVVDLETRETTLIAEDAFFPNWLQQAKRGR